uniref:Uncharacterized protein n=1 Tax=Oryza sativa subsp. japonica TaxID=39947 RepID=Q33BE2_ORYSJ|nr:hypothetical protein LOC_Os10g02610 [Oryza sativa Japonica Group]
MAPKDAVAALGDGSGSGGRCCGSARRRRKRRSEAEAFGDGDGGRRSSGLQDLCRQLKILQHNEEAQYDKTVDRTSIT